MTTDDLNLVNFYSFLHGLTFHKVTQEEYNNLSILNQINEKDVYLIDNYSITAGGLPQTLYYEYQLGPNATNDQIKHLLNKLIDIFNNNPDIMLYDYETNETILLRAGRYSLTMIGSGGQAKSGGAIGSAQAASSGGNGSAIVGEFTLSQDTYITIITGLLKDTTISINDTIILNAKCGDSATDSRYVANGGVAEMTDNINDYFVISNLQLMNGAEGVVYRTGGSGANKDAIAPNATLYSMFGNKYGWGGSRWSHGSNSTNYSTNHTGGMVALTKIS